MGDKAHQTMLEFKRHMDNTPQILFMTMFELSNACGQNSKPACGRFQQACSLKCLLLSMIRWRFSAVPCTGSSDVLEFQLRRLFLAGFQTL